MDSAIKQNIKRILNTMKKYSIGEVIYLKIVRPIVSNIMFFFPVKNNKIVFDNFFGNEYAENPRYIAEEFLQRDKKLDLVWFVKDINIQIPYGIRKVKYGSIASVYEAATAKVWIDNVRNAHLVKKKKEQLYLQTWHGSFPLKPIEKDAEDKLDSDYIRKAKYDGKIMDAILTDSQQQEEIYMRAFWLNKHIKILKFGLPKNDFLLKNMNDIELILNLRKNLNLDKDAYVVLYVPTYRDDCSVEGYKLDFNNIIKSFEMKMNKKCIIIVRLHPNVQNQSEIISYNEKILNGTYYSNIQELELLSDCLISDYSSLMFEFALLKKPIFICALDLEEYKSSRGLYDIYDKLPFSISTSNKRLIETINEIDIESYKTRSELYLKNICSYDKGVAAKRTVDWIEKHI